MAEPKPFNGSEWYNKTIEKRTLDALRAQDAETAAWYAAMSPEALLHVVRARAEELGHPPHMAEVAGAAAIAEVFGNWRSVLRAAGCGWPEGSAVLARTRRYREEYARQQELYRAERAEKLRRRREKRQEREERRAAEAEAREKCLTGPESPEK